MSLFSLIQYCTDAESVDSSVETHGDVLRAEYVEYAYNSTDQKRRVVQYHNIDAQIVAYKTRCNAAAYVHNT